MKELIEIIASIVNLEPSSLSQDTGPSNCDEWDSLAHINIITGIEERYEISFSMDEIIEINSINYLNQLVEQKRK